MNAATILAVAVPISFIGFIVMAYNNQRLSEAGLAAVSALLGAIVNGTYNSVMYEQQRKEKERDDE